MYTIGKLAKRFGLSRSTLLYYDQIGLLSPSLRSGANYRLYSDIDVQRMTRITHYREAGLSLDAIRGLLEGDASSFAAVLERHIVTLNQEIARLRHQQHVIAALLGSPQILHASRSMTKAQWVALLASSGMGEEEMCTWHAEFERNFPEAHQDFLESLGIPREEIAGIREFAANDPIGTLAPQSNAGGNRTG